MSVGKVLAAILKMESKEATNGLKNTRKEVKRTKAEIVQMSNLLAQLPKKLIQSTDASDKYNASLRLLKTTLGETTEQATAFISKLSEMSGVDETTLIKQTARFVQLGESLNMSNEQAEKFSENLSILTTKLSLLYNMDYAKMGTTIQKAMQGKPTTLTSTTGISLKESAEQATLMAYGIDRQVSSLNDAELALVKYATILRQVTSDNNAYQDAVNSLAWQKQMLAAQSRRLATAIGQLLTPILTKLYIVLNAVLMVVTELITMFASLMNVNLSLDSSVDSASDSYDNLGKAISGASNTAKKSLRSFDKLNNITTPSGGAKGGALGIDSSLLKLLDNVDENFLKIRNKATEIRDRIMEWLGFTKDVNGEWQWSSDKLLKNVGNAIKNVWNWYKKLNVVVKIFIGFALYTVLNKIVTAAISLYTTLSTKVIKIFGDFNALLQLGNGNIVKMIDAFVKTATTAEKTALAVAGITAAISGIMMIVSAIQSMKEEGVNLNNVLTLLIGTLALVAGAIGVVSVAAGGMTVSLAAATAGISLIIGALAALIAWVGTSFNPQWREVTSVMGEFNKKMQELETTYKDNIKVIDSNVSRARSLEEQLLKLVDADGKVIGSTEEASTVISALNELLDTEYKITDGQITLNGQKVKSYEALKNSVDKYCASLRAEGYLEANREKYNERLKLQQTLEELLNTEIKEIIKTQKNYDTTTEKGYVQWLEANKGRLAMMQDIKTQYNTNEQYLQAYEKAGYLVSVGRYDEAHELLTKSFNEVGATTEETIELINKKAKNIPATVNEAINYITTKQASFTLKVYADTSNASRQIDNLMRNKSISLGTSFKAEGGFVNQGELFVAREAGPEMVGSINGHTAVANNDQIVESIQSGVFNAVMSALNNTDFGGSNVTIEATGDTQGLLNFIQFKQKQQDRQFN